VKIELWVYMQGSQCDFGVLWPLCPLSLHSPASHSQNYTVEYLIHMGMTAVVLMVLGILLLKLWTTEKIRHALRRWRGERTGLSDGEWEMNLAIPGNSGRKYGHKKENSFWECA
jgi:hypothetical protein